MQMAKKSSGLGLSNMIARQGKMLVVTDNMHEKFVSTGSAVTGKIPDQSTNDDCGRIVRDLKVVPISQVDAKNLLVSNHYLHSFPGGTKLNFGIFYQSILKGAITLGVGPFLGYGLVDRATPEDCITLTRLWLADNLPRNSESHVIGILLRSLQKETSLKFVLAYSDPAAGHLGTIYQATNWIYTGLSSAAPLYDIGDGTLHHSRSLAHGLGTHSIRYLTSQGINVKTVPQMAKHRYIYFLDDSWQSRLTVPVLPYPKKRSDIDERG
jgi:hypothetical protein